MENIIKVLNENNFTKTVSGYKRNIDNSILVIDFKFKNEKILSMIIDDYVLDEDGCVIFAGENQTYFKPSDEEVLKVLNSYL